MLYTVTMFFPIIAELDEGKPKQIVYSAEVEAGNEVQALKGALEMEIVNCGGGVFAKPDNAAVYFVHATTPEADKGNGENNAGD
ncbi:hypothetical protein LCGC14_0472120 [marine sediment metagenome]|uniref:Uncharacterized protein n=1 Tax=marine sediment metagenome TaxID=412755 RepID=A0A0F9SC02_9ZZZZ